MQILNYIKKKQSEIKLQYIRHANNPEYISKGVALGLFIGFFVPVGIQLLIVIPLSFAFKVSKVMAVAFTFVSNPITVWFIYPIQIFIGSYIMFSPLTMLHIKRKLSSLLHADGNFWDFTVNLVTQLSHIFCAFLLGGMFFGIIAGVIGYKISKSLMLTLQKTKQAKQRNRKKRRFKTVTINNVMTKVSKFNNKN